MHGQVNEEKKTQQTNKKERGRDRGGREVVEQKQEGRGVIKMKGKQDKQTQQ